MHATVPVAGEVLELDAKAYRTYPHLANYNPHVAVFTQLVDSLLERGRVVLTAHKNGGPVEVFVDGVALNTGKNEVSERSLGLTIKLFDPRAILDLEQAEIIAKKVVRDGKAIVFELVPAL